MVYQISPHNWIRSTFNPETSQSVIEDLILFVSSLGPVCDKHPYIFAFCDFASCNPRLSTISVHENSWRAWEIKSLEEKLIAIFIITCLERSIPFLQKAMPMGIHICKKSLPTNLRSTAKRCRTEASEFEEEMLFAMRKDNASKEAFQLLCGYKNELNFSGKRRKSCNHTHLNYYL